MISSDTLFYIKLAASFLPFVALAFLNAKINAKKAIRNRQYIMPIFSVVYCILTFIFMDKISNASIDLFMRSEGFFKDLGLNFIADYIRDMYETWGVFLSLVLFNTSALTLYVAAKTFIVTVYSGIKVSPNSFVGSIVDVFYTYDEYEGKWYIKEHFGQAKTFVKTAYYGVCAISSATLMISCVLCMEHLVSAPFYPAFAIIIIGEIAFFIDGVEYDAPEAGLQMQADVSKHVAMYPLLRKPLKALFGDKLSAEGTSVNLGGATGSSIEDILIDLEKNGGHIGKNYSLFIRTKMKKGLKPSADYLRCGYDLSMGKSLVFNTPFYDKINPYVFYAINRQLLVGGKVLVVLGRHGTEEDLYQWCEEGMKGVSNIPGMWRVGVLSDKVVPEDELPDIGIITRSGVHNLDIHKNNREFLSKVSFVFIVEPSKLVATAQIGLNLLIKCCGKERAITFCTVDRNCDGLVDALSHILLTNLTEVSATEYPQGISSYMCWTADTDYLQHRLLPGVSRYLGLGTEISMVALKNQVKRAVWYGGEAYPVQDARWIAKQYYYDLLNFAKLPTNQEAFDKYFHTSFNLCNEKVSGFSFVTVEDDRFNLFETRRSFATIAEQQGFVNVISSEYMLREYMSSNSKLFTADAKAIPYIAADYANTKRNAILSIALLLCIGTVKEEVLLRKMTVMNMNTSDPISEIWNEICILFCGREVSEVDKNGAPVIVVKDRNGKTVRFVRDETIIFRRDYSVDSGRFESCYVIENSDFANIILEDLQNAKYIAEHENEDIYIGTELKGHVYQKYMPGQFFTLNGKYYEMISTTAENQILVRRASEHIGGRLSYRQVRNYNISHLEDSTDMGALKYINDIGIHYQYADFSVETPGYWKLKAHNDFDKGDLIKVNGIPSREYHHKQIVKLDFSRFGDAFSDSVRMTLTNLLNETFVSLFAENQPFISAITIGEYDAPITYSLSVGEGVETSEKCIFIVEDSQLDIGLLVAVERNVNRILNIISDYLSWNDEKINESLNASAPEVTAPAVVPFNAYSDDTPKTKKNVFSKIGDFVKGIFKKKKPAQDGEKPEHTETAAEASDTAETAAAGENTEVNPKDSAKEDRKAKKEKRKKDKSKGQKTEEDNTEADKTEDENADSGKEEAPAKKPSLWQKFKDKREDSKNKRLEKKLEKEERKRKEAEEKASKESAEEATPEDSEENSTQTEKEVEVSAVE